MFGALENMPAHPLTQLYAIFAQDHNPEKLDLGIGVYRDAQGRCPIMPSVRLAMQRLAEPPPANGKMDPRGQRPSKHLMEELVFSAKHSKRSSRYRHSTQPSR